LSFAVLFVAPISGLLLGFLMFLHCKAQITLK